MLPFLKRNKEASASIPEETIKREPDEESEYDGLESCAQELIDAVHSKDAKAVCTALRSAFELMDSEPHIEGEHLNG